jgi:hypothetical protein
MIDRVGEWVNYVYDLLDVSSYGLGCILAFQVPKLSRTNDAVTRPSLPLDEGLEPRSVED